MVQMEADLDRAVMVTMAGNGQDVSPAMAAAAIHAQLGLEVDVDFSIRALQPADFLILCSFMEQRDLLLGERVITSLLFSLPLEPWSHQVGGGAS
jgi:hypothetical protein